MTEPHDPPRTQTDRPSAAESPNPDTPRSPADQGPDLASAARLFWAALLRALGRGARQSGRAATTGVAWAGARSKDAAAAFAEQAARRKSARDARTDNDTGTGTDTGTDTAQATGLRQRAGAAWRAQGDRRRARLAAPPARAVRASRWIWRTITGVVLVLLVLFAIAVGTIGWALRDLPLADILPPLEEPTLTVVTGDGDTLFSRGAYRADYVAYDQMPDYLPLAVVAVEDRRFFDHGGIDLQGISRAAWRNLRQGGVVEGGSTISQQLVKVLYLDPDRTFKRKLQEMIVAFAMERQLGKQRILELYLNSTYLGSGAWGMPAAAQVYFDRPVSELSLAQSAMLAAAIRAPSVINPEADIDRARTRAAMVLGQMRDQQLIDAAAHDAAVAELQDLVATPPAARAGGYFADWVLSEAQQIGGAVDGGITVTATLDTELQAEAERIISEAMAGPGAAAGASQAALVAMTPDGRVRAMVGGVDYGASQFNRATEALRQPGSTFKLPVFLAALVMGATPDTIVPDEPIDIDGWKPENFDGRYNGNVTLQEAFARSLNAATVRLATEVGVENIIAVARQLGIEGELTETPSLALGTSEVTLLDMTEAYAGILAAKAPIKATGISTLSFGAEGRSLSVSGSNPDAVELTRTREPMLSMLRAVVANGTGKRAAVDGFAAGKTGTSQNSRDAWFIGFTDKLVVGVWIGNDDNSPMDAVTGGSLPAEIWREVVLAADATGQRPARAEAAPRSANEVRVRRGTAPPTQAGGQQCDIRACSRAYRSFRAADCSYQPYSGPRQVCTR